MIVIQDLVYRIAGRPILDGASAMIPDGARVGLVGRNGAGKTTLMRLLLGEIAPEQGTMQMSRGARIGQVAQEAPATDEPILSIVLSADKERAALLAEADIARDAARIADIHARLNDIDAHAAPARAARILSGLGFDPAAQQRPAREFSGGWRMRVALAGVLFSEPDVLLLDEPTNYLDLEGTLWLEGHLARYPHTLIIVSHDRDLLNGAIDQILHLERGKLTLWRGNYDSFERQRREKRVLDAKAMKKQEEERKHLQAFVDRFRASATKATQAQSRLKRIQKLQPIEAMVEDRVQPFVFPKPEKSLASPIIALDHVAVGYGDRPILRDLSLRIDADDRIGLLGSNGNGKSTFAKLISARLEPMHGERSRASTLKVGYFAQHQLDDLMPGRSVLDHVRQLMPGEGEAKVRGRAAQFGFPGERVDTKVEALSGGEKARLLMGLATFAAPHLLVLDEPTNHLDIDARAALVDAVNSFPGAVILISHDRYLIDACVDRLWLVRDGTVRNFEGDLEDYRKLILSGETNDNASKPQAKRAASDADKKAAAERRAALGALRKRIEVIDGDIERLRKRLAGIDALLADPRLYERDPAKSTELAKLRRSTDAAINAAEEEWLNLSGEIEQADVA